MNKVYESPTIEYVKLRLSADILEVSKGEKITTGGEVVNPDDDLLLDP